MALTKHIHADIIHAYAEGSTIEVRSNENYSWEVVEYPSFSLEMEYRIKPEPDADIVLYSYVENCSRKKDYAYVYSAREKENNSNMKITFDGVTHRFKSVEKI